MRMVTSYAYATSRWYAIATPCRSLIYAAAMIRHASRCHATLLPAMRYATPLYAFSPLMLLDTQSPVADGAPPRCRYCRVLCRRHAVLMLLLNGEYFHTISPRPYAARADASAALMLERAAALMMLLPPVYVMMPLRFYFDAALCLLLQRFSWPLMLLRLIRHDALCLCRHDAAMR